eukprot:scaffold1355_cov268-Pinguiococcus_pyrenoidosus.AAC.81
MLLVSRPFGSTLTSQQVAPEGLVFKVDDCSLNRVSLLSGAGEGREAPVAGEEPGELNAVPELLQRPMADTGAGLSTPRHGAGLDVSQANRLTVSDANGRPCCAERSHRIAAAARCTLLCHQ